MSRFPQICVLLAEWQCMEAFRRLSGTLDRVTSDALVVDRLVDARDQAEVLVEVQGEPGFDETVRLTAELLDFPIAAISILGQEEQIFKAQIGLPMNRTPIEHAFCSHTVDQNDGLVVEDTTRDHRFNTNPFVTGDLGIRAYAGAPLVMPDGRRVGALFVLDRIPRTISAAKLNTLHLLSRQVVIQMQLEEMIARQAKDILDLQLARSELTYLATHDPLTTLLNRRGILDHLTRLVTPADESVPPVDATLFFIDLDGFKAVNDTYGHDCGDRVLAAVARRIRNHLPASARAGRLGGDEFVAVVHGNDPEHAKSMAASLVDVIRQPLGRDDRAIAITTSIGVALSDGTTGASGLMTMADRAMYRAKQTGGSSMALSTPAAV